MSSVNTFDSKIEVLLPDPVEHLRAVQHAMVSALLAEQEPKIFNGDLLDVAYNLITRTGVGQVQSIDTTTRDADDVRGGYYGIEGN